jgi:hypothetical protein
VTLLVHLGGVWFDPALRPPALKTERGEEVVVEDPGLWNLEAGPDFLGAALRIGPGRRRITGDVEIHIHPSDWAAHRHRTDPRYAGVRVHVTYYPGRAAAGSLPAGALQLALKDALAANPMFSAGLERIGFAARHIWDRSAGRVLAHATSGPALQQNLVAVMEGRG